MAQRISRAKQRIKAAGASFDLPPPAEQAERLGDVLQVVYLVFNEGYTATSGAQLVRAELTAEAIRLARELHRLVPGDGEVAGLLGLLLLTDARRQARTAPDGSLVPLSEQDRTLWNTTAIAEGVALVSDTLSRGPIGAYSSRPPSPPSTTRHPPPKSPTGRRFWPSTRFWSAWHPTRR